MAESSMIATAGGAIGVAAATAAISAASRGVAIPLALDWLTVIGSLAAAGLSGIAAGWYPARRAARLDVINALRQE
jgi:ABC-type antimicrobial peptide transport system permease subunit